MDCCDNLKKMFLVCVLLFYLLCTCDAKVIDILKKNRYYLNFPRYLELLRRQNMTKLNKEPKVRKTNMSDVKCINFCSAKKNTNRNRIL